MLASYHYHKGGPLQTLCYGNGLQTEYHYQEDGSPAGLVTMTAQGKVLLNLRYAYDGNGNCTEKSGEPYQNTYTYDRMNRLTGSIQDGKGVRYAYDPAGNRLRKETGQETETYHYNAKNQLIERHTREGVIRYNYDPQGNLLEEQGETFRKQYAYDAAGRQISVAVSGSAHGADRTGRTDRAEGINRAEASGSAGHAWKQRFSQLNRYDGENLRYETEENGKVIRFLFDRGELAEERREDAQIRYIRGYDPLLLIQNGEEQSRFSFVQDEAGSTLFLLDEAHEIRKSYRYDAFGDILQEMGDIPNRLTYTGQIYDGAAEQYYLRARFYNPVLGRFLQEDTYRGDGLNLYAYCANNPVMYYDPSGYITLLCDIKKTEPTNKTGKDILGPYYEILKQKHIENPEFFPDPDTLCIVEGNEYIKMRKEYASMVRDGKLQPGHHILGIADGGTNVRGNITPIGEKFIPRNMLPPEALDYYDSIYATKRNPHPSRIAVYEVNGIVRFGKNPAHTEATTLQQNIHIWQKTNNFRRSSLKW